MLRSDFSMLFRSKYFVFTLILVFAVCIVNGRGFCWYSETTLEDFSALLCDSKKSGNSKFSFSVIKHNATHLKIPALDRRLEFPALTMSCPNPFITKKKYCRVWEDEMASWKKENDKKLPAGITGLFLSVKDLKKIKNFDFLAELYNSSSVSLKDNGLSKFESFLVTTY